MIIEKKFLGIISMCCLLTACSVDVDNYAIETAIERCKDNKGVNKITISLISQNAICSNGLFVEFIDKRPAK